MSIHFSCFHLLLRLLLNPIIGVHGSVKRLHVCMVGFLCLACDCEHWVCPLRISGRVVGISCMGDGFTGHIGGLLLLFGWVIIFCKGDIVHIPRQFRYE